VNLGDDAVQTTNAYLKRSMTVTSIALMYGLKSTLDRLRNAEPKILKGKTTLQKIMARTRSVKATDINKDDEIKFDSLCRKYGVMYNAVPDQDQTKVSIFYREEDIERVQKALDNMNKDVVSTIKETEIKEVAKGTITKDDITKVQNNFENIINELADTANYEVILDNSIDGISELSKVKSKAVEKEPLKVKIEKAKQEQAKAPPKPKKELTMVQKTAIYKSLGGR
jgi:hypothetical protein